MPSPKSRIKDTQRRYRERHRDAINARKRAEYASNKDAHRLRTKAYREANRKSVYAYNRSWRRAYYSKLRAETVTAYGGRCACCGEREPRFLHIDHVHGDGRAHRAEVGNSQTLCKWLKDRNWPRRGFRLLCANCNLGRQLCGGVCPHKLPK